MHLKSPVLYSFAFMLALCPITSIFCHDFDDDLDIYSIEAPLRTECNFADQIVPVLNECGIIEIFKENIFNKTNSLNKRSLLDEPLFQTPFPQDHRVLIRATAFFNMINRNYFTGASDSIASYVGILNDSLIYKIEQVFNNINTDPDCNEFFIGFLGLNPDIFNINIKKIACLFANATTQERRIGAMLEIMKNTGRWSIGFRVPLLLQERNLFITDAEIDAIDETLQLPPATDDEINQFAQSHMISDKAGFGDTRLMLSYQASDKEKLDLQLCLYSTAPTAFAVQTGIFGSQFPKKCLTPPPFDFCSLLNAGLTPEALEHRLKHEGTILGDEFLDNLSANLLEDSLGNGGHWGLGFSVEPTLLLNEYWVWHTRGSFEYMFPATENRFFVQDANVSEFEERDFSSRDTDIAEDNLRFLNHRLLNMFYPSSFGVEVRPGPIAMVTSDVTFQTDTWWFTAGNDLWYQGKEHIEFEADQFLFDHNKVIKPFAFEYKLFGGISRALYREHSSWLLSLKADGTVASSGIGKGFMVTLGAITTW